MLHIEGNLYIFSSAFYVATHIVVGLSCAFSEKKSVRKVINLKDVFDIIAIAEKMRQNILSINMTAAHGAYHNFDVDHIGPFKRGNILADASSEIKDNVKLHGLIISMENEIDSAKYIMRINITDRNFPQKEVK